MQIFNYLKKTPNVQFWNIIMPRKTHYLDNACLAYGMQYMLLLISDQFYMWEQKSHFK